MKTKTTNPGFFDRPLVQKVLWGILWSVCVVSVVLEFFVHRESHFGDHGIDATFSFYALLGFIACLVCILVAKFMGLFLKVKETGL